MLFLQWKRAWFFSSQASQGPLSHHSSPTIKPLFLCVQIVTMTQCLLRTETVAHLALWHLCVSYRGGLWKWTFLCGPEYLVTWSWRTGARVQLGVLTVRKQKAQKPESGSAKRSPHMLTACHCESCKVIPQLKEKGPMGRGEWVMDQREWLWTFPVVSDFIL